jgi:hypothetical protein
MTAQWHQVENSYFLLVRVQREGWALPEWTNGGEVQLRQVYSTEPPSFCAIVEDPTRGRTIIDRFPGLREAQEAVETRFRALL